MKKLIPKEKLDELNKSLKDITSILELNILMIFFNISITILMIIELKKRVVYEKRWRKFTNANKTN